MKEALRNSKTNLLNKAKREKHIDNIGISIPEPGIPNASRNNKTSPGVWIQRFRIYTFRNFQSAEQQYKNVIEGAQTVETP